MNFPNDMLTISLQRAHSVGMLATTLAKAFGEWVAAKRADKGVQQADLARRIEKKLGASYTRDKLFDLEHGSPKYPSADLVTAVAAALDVPVTEALAALGYELPESAVVLHPALQDVLVALSWAQQEMVAQALPGLMALAGTLQNGYNPVNHPLTSITTEGCEPVYADATTQKEGHTDDASPTDTPPKLPGDRGGVEQDTPRVSPLERAASVLEQDSRRRRL